MKYNFRKIEEKDNKAIAKIVRDNLEQVGLDIPGTAYFDEGLDHLSELYKNENGKYFVLIDELDNVVGGVGFSPCDFMDDTAELQKLYLSDSVKGSGLGYEMLHFIEDEMRACGFRKVYLETHTVLKAALHIYEKTGYYLIPRPNEVIHSTMDSFYVKDL
ncbi:MAG: GNAT family N-acetyltransferase [Pseudobutyrivibrio sp.]|nr:GNAT family N-acetyltransferase [Pseudobutyrivibrio sp.]